MFTMESGTSDGDWLEVEEKLTKRMGRRANFKSASADLKFVRRSFTYQIVQCSVSAVYGDNVILGVGKGGIRYVITAIFKGIIFKADFTD